MMTEIFQIVKMSAPATETLKTSARKNGLCGSSWQMCRTVSLPGPCKVKEPDSLMATSTVHSTREIEWPLDGLHEVVVVDDFSPSCIF